MHIHITLSLDYLSVLRTKSGLTERKFGNDTLSANIIAPWSIRSAHYATIFRSTTNHDASCVTILILHTLPFKQSCNITTTSSLYNWLRGVAEAYSDSGRCAPYYWYESRKLYLCYMWVDKCWTPYWIMRWIISCSMGHKGVRSY